MNGWVYYLIRLAVQYGSGQRCLSIAGGIIKSLKIIKKKLDSYGTFVVTYIVMLKDNIMILNDDIIITEPTDEELAEIESELSDIINDDSDELDQ